MNFAAYFSPEAVNISSNADHYTDMENVFQFAVGDA